MLTRLGNEVRAQQSLRVQKTARPDKRVDIPGNTAPDSWGNERGRNPLTTSDQDITHGLE
jgi:hypothetical protein